MILEVMPVLEIEKILQLAADMESLAPAGDKLSALINVEDDELMDEELDLIAAAASHPSYSRFLELAESRGIKAPSPGRRK